MKTIRRSVCALCVFGFSLASARETSPRLTVELRDGSRVIGQSLDDQLKFHSALLGDLKLALKNIRTIDCPATNSAKLTTTSGDILNGWFIADDLPVKTSFGTSELPVGLIRSVRLSPARAAGQLPAGLIALWSGEGDGTDSVGGHNALLNDITFADGKVGRAFSFNGTSSYFKIPDSPALDVGRGDGFTITAWIKPSRVDGIYNVIEWDNFLCAFQIGQNPTDQGGLITGFRCVDRNEYFLRSGPGTIVAHVFQHLALTYDRSSGIGTLYVNGMAVDQSHLGNLDLLTNGGLRFGYRPSQPGEWTYHRYFNGLMDEIAVYNRALTASEIQNICQE